MRVEISETRFHAQVSDLVEVTKVIAMDGAAEPARVSWASTSNKPDSAGAIQFAYEIRAAAMLACELDDAIKNKDGLKWATVARSKKQDDPKIVCRQIGDVVIILIIIPADWVIYAHGYEIQEVA